MALNCWEFKKCERQAGGSNVPEHGVCPAFEESKLDGEHDGRNAVRTCWVVAGTFCGGEQQGTFADKQNNCAKCDFYKSVRDEEGRNFQMTMGLLRKLRN